MNRIAQLRKEQNMSQADLAEKMNVHQTAVSQWETGRTSPGLDMMAEMSKMFDVEVSYLMGHGDMRKYTQEYLNEQGATDIAERDYDHYMAYQKLDDHGKHIVDLVTQAELTRMGASSNAET